MLSSNSSQISHSPSVTQWRAQTSSTNLCIQAIGPVSAERGCVEDFIKDGFKRSFNASIEVSTEFLITLKQGQLKSALGLRNAKKELFIEQYLATTIEETLAQQQCNVERRHIAEIAHLYSNAKMFTLPLLLVTAVSLKLKGFEVMCFTGTPHVIRLIRKTGIDVNELAPACASKLRQSPDCWGTYYDSNPIVSFISLTDVLKVIQQTPKLSTMLGNLDTQIGKVVKELLYL